MTFASKVSPAKMALRRHLSQERLPTTQQPQQQQQQQPTSSEHQMEPKQPLHQQGQTANGRTLQSNSLLGTRTIGDLVSGEIERTLEISNQTIINAAVDMSVITGGPESYSSNPGRSVAVAEAETTGLATLAHVASYAPPPVPIHSQSQQSNVQTNHNGVPIASTSSVVNAKTSVLYAHQTNQQQR